MWRTLFQYLSSLLKSLGLIAKILNTDEFLQLPSKKLFLRLYMIIKIISIYEDRNNNRQANVEHMNLKGISQVYINWKTNGN
jgi:hypothetical protein